MKIFLDYELNETGKGKFLQRLKPELELLGCEFVSNPKHADVALGVSRWRTRIKGIPKVLRIDGVHVNKTAVNIYKNDNIRKSIKKSDAVIYQSKFAQRMVNGILGINPAKQNVIFNGSIIIDLNVKKNDCFDIAVVGNWGNRPTKRLKEMVEIADMMWLMKSSRIIRFHVFGDAIEYMPFSDLQKNIYWHGHINTSNIYDCFEPMDMMLNLQWFDWCPNAVVEALCCGVPVMCGNGCGVEEIVQDNGWVLPINKPLKAKMFRYSHAPDFDKEMVANKIIEVSKQEPKKVNAEHLYIENIAKQYKQVFEDVLNAR